MLKCHSNSASPVVPSGVMSELSNDQPDAVQSNAGTGLLCRLSQKSDAQTVLSLLCIPGPAAQSFNMLFLISTMTDGRNTIPE